MVNGDTIGKVQVANVVYGYFVYLATKEHNPACATYLTEQSSESAFLVPTTAIEVIIDLSPVKNGTFCDADDLQNKPIRRRHVLVVLLLCCICAFGIFPQK